MKRIISKHYPYMKENFKIKEIGIFGSFVKNKADIDDISDIDILISFKKGHKDFFNYMRLKYYLEVILGRKVDLVIKDAIKPRLREKILQEVKYV
ncbi:MAG TPA: nucleotidyltransferase domain-containing protein [Atribacterota bacterium]|nr:nucleotidyltransferase domain-containing protein [Atribacterota bacterium]